MELSLEQWIAKYNKKTKETFTVKPFATLLYECDKGFMQYAVHGSVNGIKTFMIYEVIGNGKWWQLEAVRIAKENNCKQLLTTTRISPEKYKKLFPETYIYSWVMVQNIE